ncbi:MAG TPA: glycosyltransferase, partial [Anaerolineales bacterium]|nr:glycosyltransferase [Anaerolineales bacterium]
MSAPQQPLVTIVTPSYNQAEYLEQTLRSVLNQDYPNIEYLVVDGGSTDGSVEIIKAYADRLAWWVSEPDQGQADAINKGFARATGKYIAWLNSDDVYLPGTIARAVEELEADPKLGLVYANLLSINTKNEHVNTIRYRQYALEDLLAFFIIGQPTVFLRRSVLERVGYLSLDYHYLLDHHLWLRFAAESQIRYIREPWSAARYHPTAKNMAMAEHFGGEAFRILAWAKTQPVMADVINHVENRILGGVHAFNARYLLDAKQPARALKAYRQVWKYYPEFYFKVAHRVLFAYISLLGLGGLRRLIYWRYLVPPPEKKEPQSDQESAIKSVGLISYTRRKPGPVDTLPPLLVTGVHRSSTTWVGKMLTANKQYTYISEPLNVLHRSGVMRVPVSNWYTYISEENEQKYLSAFYETMTLQYHLWQELGTLRSLKDFGRMLRDAANFAYGRRTRKQVLLKDPFAVFSARWFADRLGCKIVLAVRHPAAFVSSLKRLDWPFQFEDLEAQPALMHDWLEPYREEMEAAQHASNDLVFQGSLLWRMIYTVVLQYRQTRPDFLIVRHEDLSLDPLQEFQAMYQALGIPFTLQVAREIRKSTNPGNPTELPLESIHSVNLDSRANL